MGKAIMYERIYGDLLAKIQSGDYQPGDRLPSEKESAEFYGVSRITAKKAMDMLAKEKKISREPGRGSFVCSPAAVVEMKKESRGNANQRIGSYTQYVSPPKIQVEPLSSIPVERRCSDAVA